MNKKVRAVIKIGLCGATGKTGLAILEMINSLPKKFMIGGEISSLNTSQELANMCQNSDIIIDFSNPAILPQLLEMCVLHKKALILGTTGFGEIQIALLKEASHKIPLLYSANMSYGANLVAYLAKQCARLLDEEYDSEIIEYHHRYKKDAPSGTAIMLAKEIAEARNSIYEEAIVFSRNNTCERNNNEIGISSIRGGGMMGEHEIIFVNNNEIIKMNHQVFHRSAYADGALKAAIWIYDKPPGFYSMKDILST